jgi:hypothetical protein
MEMGEPVKYTAAEVASALERSIAHWEENAAVPKIADATMGSKDCALCCLFFWKPGRCGGCPVRESTGLKWCEGTPYIDACNAKTLPQFKRAARAEVAFLKSLRVPLKKGKP